MRRKKFYCYICKKSLEFHEMALMYNYWFDRLVPVCKDDRLCYPKEKGKVNGEICQKSKDKPDWC